MKNKEQVLRWDKTARTIHWLFIIGVTAGIISGLPVFDGKIFGTLYNLIGGPNNRTILHYYITTITLSITIPLIIYRLICFTRQCESLTKRGEDWLPCTADIKKQY